jgi:hypothetical protein
MRSWKSLVLFLALAGSLTLAACGAQNGPHHTTCIGPRPVSDVHAVGNNVNFTLTSPVFSEAFAVSKSAFGGAPAAMKDGDLVRICTATSGAGGHSTTTITQFSDQGQPPVTSTPPSR